MANADPADLYDVTWVLTRIDDANGLLGQSPSGHVTLTFDSGGSARDNHGNLGRARVEDGRIRFEGWTNDLVGRPGRGPGLTVAQTRLVFGILRGDVSWTITEDELTLTRPGTGSLIFVSQIA